jgi:hypothetical protein
LLGNHSFPLCSPQAQQSPALELFFFPCPRMRPPQFRIHAPVPHPTPFVAAHTAPKTQRAHARGGPLRAYARSFLWKDLFFWAGRFPRRGGMRTRDLYHAVQLITPSLEPVVVTKEFLSNLVKHTSSFTLPQPIRPLPGTIFFFRCPRMRPPQFRTHAPVPHPTPLSAAQKTSKTQRARVRSGLRCTYARFLFTKKPIFSSKPFSTTVLSPDPTLLPSLHLISPLVKVAFVTKKILGNLVK